MHVQVRINRKVKMKSTKTQCYVAEKKFRERYPKIQLRSSSQRSTQLPFESGTSRAISTVAILLCLSFLVSLVLQYWSVSSSKRKDLQETKQELLFHSNQDQFVRGCLRGRCLGTLNERTRDLIYLKFVATDFFPKIISPSAGENSGDLA